MTSNRQNVFHALQEELLFAVSEGADVQEGLNSAAEKMEFLPKDALQIWFCWFVPQMKNCLFKAVSILLTGNELLSTELRVRCGIALLQLKDQLPILKVLLYTN